MVFFIHLDTAAPCLDLQKGMFISTEMSEKLSQEINAGNVTLNIRLVPVHLPWEGLFKINYGEHDDLRIEEEDWLKIGLPSQYNGENLTDKNLIVFPMHGLGDQLYLAIALRNLEELYPSLKIVIVRPSIKSAEQWYPYIYNDHFFSTSGPVVTTDEMIGYDYYVDAEHFAHMKEYEGVYPPEFYMKYFFFNTTEKVSGMRPVISPCLMEKVNKSCIDELLGKLRTFGKPVVFVSAMTTGRVRDLPIDAIFEFIELAKDDYSFVISAYKNKKLEDEIKQLNLQNVVTTGGYINNIDELIYLLTNMDYIITSDSGITHLAEALKIPCGSVFNVVTPEERTRPYKFSEEMMVEFEIPGVCKTPCYVHALEDSNACPGMKWKNEQGNKNIFRVNAPCMENFTGEHLMLLIESLVSKFTLYPAVVDTLEK